MWTEMCRLHCHLVVKLSSALQKLALNEIVCNLHGTSPLCLVNHFVSHLTFNRSSRYISEQWKCERWQWCGLNPWCVLRGEACLAQGIRPTTESDSLCADQVTNFSRCMPLSTSHFILSGLVGRSLWMFTVRAHTQTRSRVARERCAWMYSRAQCVIKLKPLTFLQVTFHGGVDHAQLTEHRVLVNPSLSEVLCTTNMEVCWYAASATES
jgi:hypothetical protein